MSETSQIEEAILENLGEALIIIDQRGAIIRFTSAAETLFQYDRSEVLGRNIAVLMPEDIGRFHQGFVEGYNANEKSTVLGKTRELMGLRKDGHKFPVDVTITRVESEGRIFFVGLLKDITEKLNSIKLLNQSLVQAQVASKAKSEFLENMCHEIRTPMNGVLGTLQILKQQTPAATESSRLLEHALTSSRLLMKILNDLLDFSKIESNKLDIESMPFSVVTCAQDALSTFAESAHSKQLKLSFHHQLDADCLWLGDVVRVQQIMLNLLSNAIKFSDKGTITLTLEEAQGGLTLSVKDEGIGMSDAQIQTLCERFRQGDTSTTRKYGGTGLGMAIVNNLVRLMGGCLDASSRLGEGTTITIHLPLAKQASTETNHSTSNTTKAVPELAGRSIVVVDDNDINLLVMEEVLKPTMAQVELLSSGELAVKYCQSHRVDFVFMDIQMPGMDGIEALRQLKVSGLTAPVVALTANTNTSQVAEYKAAGFDNVLPKPIDFDSLYRLLRGYFESGPVSVQENPSAD